MSVRTTPLALLAAGLIAFGCECSPRSAPGPDLLRVAVDKDSTGLASLIVFKHKLVRDQLEAHLTRLLRAKTATDHNPADTLARSLGWLVSEYETITKIGDKSRKFRLFNSWTLDQARRKRSLDSTYHAADSAYRAPGRAQTQAEEDAYLASLHQLGVDYGLILDSGSLASVEFNSATIWDDRGQEDSCRYYLTNSLRISEAIGYIEQAGLCEYRLARVLKRYSADLGKAEQALNRAERWYRQAGMDREITYVLVDRAATLAGLNQSASAIDLYEQAVTSATAMSDKRQVDYCLNEIGEAFYDLGLLDSAYHYSDSALQLAKEIVKSRPRLIATLGYRFSTLGLIAAARKDYETARGHFREADKIAVESGDGDLLCTNNIRWAALEIDNREYREALSLCRHALTRASRFEDILFANYGIAVANYFLGKVDSARASLHACIEGYERSRERLPRPEAKTGMLADKIGFYNLLAESFLQEYERTAQRDLIDSAYFYLERSKAQSFLEYMQEQDIDSPRTAEDMSSATLPVSPSSRFVYAHPPTLHYLQTEALHDDELLLEYFLNEIGSWVFIVSPKAIAIRQLPVSTDSIRTLVHTYVRNIDHYPSPTDDLSTASELARNLYSILIPESFISGAKAHCIVVPTGPLCLLPFEALINSGGHFFVENHVVSYQQSMTVREELSGHSRTTLKSRDVAILSSAAPGGAQLDSLPYARREADSLIRILGDGLFNVYNLRDATVSDLLSLQGRAWRFLHIAAHGTADGRYPGHSRLIFSHNDTDGAADSITASEIAGLHLSADLTVLSSCQSGAGHSFPGEGVLSLAQPFLVAGSRSVVVTYWNVFDRYSSEIIPEFYRGHFGGRTKAESLSFAKRGYLRSKSGIARDPYFWAPYVLIGSDD